jgi:hypothetical protein
MQPKTRFNKTLLAGAFILSAGNTLTASADTFTVTASAIPDVDVQTVVGTQISFGTGVIGSKVGESCILAGIAHVSESDLKHDLTNAENGGAPGTLDNGTNLVTASPITGDACVANTTGQIAVLEIDGSDSATVTVSVAPVVGTGWTYTAGATSCVVDFDRALSDVQDPCRLLTTNTVSGIGMSAAQTGEGVADATGSNETPDNNIGFASIVGKTRMVLAGTLTIDSAIPSNTAVTDNIIVQVTYE